MRMICWPAITALLLAMSGTALAEQEQRLTILVPEAEVRSGPSANANYYVTSKLKRGDQVTVVRQHDAAWLAIKPPRPGQDSFSWVNTRDIRWIDSRTVAVTAAETPIRVGSRLYNKPPTVEQVRASKGTLLSVVGQAEPAADGAWLPVAPAPREVRYIPVSAVTANSIKAGPAEPAVLQPLETGVSTSQNTGAVTSGVGIDRLVARGQQELVAGNTRTAIGLFEQAAQESPDHGEKMRLLNLAQLLRDGSHAGRRSEQDIVSATGRWGTGTTGQSPAASSTTTAPPVQDRLQPRSVYSNPAGATEGVRLQAPAQHTAAGRSAEAAAWYGPARLSRTLLKLEGKPVYRYEPTNGGQFQYVVAGAGVNLSQFAERSVYLHGVWRYHGEMRHFLMTASQVSPAQ